MYCFDNARDPVQLARMHALDALGICYFCPASLHGLEQQTRPTLYSGHWTVIKNDFPYPGAAHHLLLVPHQHATAMHLLSPATQADFWATLDAVVNLLEAESYSLGVRCGNCISTGATIEHVHVHFLVSSEDPEAPALKMRFGPRKKAA